jgi:RHS repeat-associated protein
VGTFAYNLRFPGQYYDVETGKHYNYYRDYDPSTGRYIQSDPLGLEAGLNTFSYVHSSPLSLSDPLGLKVEIRCRPVGNPNGADFRSSVAAGLGGEHCFVVVSCGGVSNGVNETTISYLAGGMTISPKGGGHSNDTVYSQQGRSRPIDVKPPASCEGDSCKFERCILTVAENLKYTDYRVPNYSAFGNNSNSVARRLVEICGGQASGAGPLTGWRNSGSVGF